MNFRKLNEFLMKRITDKYENVVRYTEVDENTLLVIPDPAACGWFVPRSELYLSAGKMWNVSPRLIGNFYPSIDELTVPENEIKPTPHYIREGKIYCRRFEGAKENGERWRAYIDEQFLKWLNVPDVRFYQYPFPEKDLRKQPIVAVGTRYISEDKTEKYPIMVILPVFFNFINDAY